VLPSISPLVAEGAGRARYFQSAYDESDDGPSLGPAFGQPSIEAGDPVDVPDAPPITAPKPPRMLQTPPAPSPAQAAVNAKRRSQMPARTQAPSSTPYPGATQIPSPMKTPGRTQSSTRFEGARPDADACADARSGSLDSDADVGASSPSPPSAPRPLARAEVNEGSCAASGRCAIAFKLRAAGVWRCAEVHRELQRRSYC